MKGESIKNVLIIGAGTMGQEIGIQSAIKECLVKIYDINNEILESAKSKIFRMLNNMVNWKMITRTEADLAYQHISYTSDPVEAADGADILSENVPEDPDLKRKIFSQFNLLCSPQTIFTTNTSTLLPSDLAASTGRPDKFLAFHFHDITLTKVVDVMPHPGTSMESIEAVKNFAERLGQSPIVLKVESNGYVFNNMLTALFYSALSLAANGVSVPWDIDRAWMGVTHMNMGPFGMMDNIGLDTIYKATANTAKKAKDPQGAKNAEFIRNYVEQGKLGRKVKKGIYTYPNPEFTRQDFQI